MSQGFSDPNPFEAPRQPGRFGEYSPQPPPQGKKSSSMIILIVLAVVGGGFFLLCCGGSVGVVMLGMDIAEAEVEAQLRDNPVLRDKLGEMQSCQTNFARSVAENDDDTFVYEVEGTKGSGTLTVTTDWDDQITFAKLRLPDGEEIVLVGE